MSMSRRDLFCFALFLFATAPFSFAQGTYTQIDYPGAYQTSVIGINTAGDMVGTYEDTNSVWHGFLLSNGTFTAIDYPGGQGTYTYAFGINDVGQIVGLFLENQSSEGFLYDLNTQTYSLVSFPNAHSFTYPSDISNDGTIVGNVQLNRAEGPIHIGFELKAGVYRIVRTQPYPYSIISGINNLQQAVGILYDSNNYVNVLFDGKFEKLRLPDQAEVFGINDAGEIVGAYSRTNGTTVGFLTQGTTIQFLVFPESTFTDATKVNNSGSVVGYFFDASELEHGFLWTPDAPTNQKGTSH